MSRTIDLGSIAKSSRQSGAQFVAIRTPFFAAMTALIVRSICAPNLSSWLPQITRPSRTDSHAVLGGVNALRFAPTVRSARPAGVDPACAPLDSCICAMVEV
jgi:hypothetical protein